MSNYIISPSATRDLNQIADYFLARNLETGENYLDLIKSAKTWLFCPT